MSFFQNKNTFTTILSTLVTAGDDYTPLDSWNDFLTSPFHAQRKLAFQEFIYIMYYCNNRTINGREFPHNDICNKTLHFFVKKDLSIISPPTKIPQNGSDLNIFTLSGVGSNELYDPVDSIDHLPALRDTTEASFIKDEITAALIANETSLGIFQEMLNIFAYYYLVKRLALLNDYLWVFDHNLVGDRSGIVAAKYPFNFNIRKNAIISNINVTPSLRPYIYNTLLKVLTDNNFNTITTPYPASSVMILNNLNDLKMTFFTMFFDPFKYMGVRSGMYSVDNYEWAGGLEPRKNKINIEMDSTIGWRTVDRFNRFIYDFYKVMSNGNRSDNPVPLPYTESDPSKSNNLGRYLSDSGSVVDGGKQYLGNNELSTALTKNNILSSIYSLIQQIQLETQHAIEYETGAMSNILLSDIFNKPKNIILASGQGNTTTSLFGIQCFGVPFFKYKLSSDCVVSGTNELPNFYTISNTNKNIIHIAVTGLDLNTDTSKIVLTGLSNEKFEFELIPLSSSTKNYSIQPINTSLSNFICTIDSLTKNASYYKRVVVTGLVGGVSTPISQDILIAQYINATQDLIFPKFPESELLSYGIPLQRTINVYMESGIATDNRVEEFQLLLSAFEDQSPQPKLFSTDALYKLGTFQLVNTPNLPTENKASYNRMFSSLQDKNTIRYIFDCLKRDFVYSTNLTTLEIPNLKGSFVGKLISGNNPRVGEDFSYAPKFTGGIDEIISPSDININKAWYNLLKYSYAKINIEPGTASMSSVVGVSSAIQIRTHRISIEINSFVSPDQSNLDTKYNTGSPEKTLYLAKKGSGSNNQMLAMLRSFGLLEAIVNKMINLLTNDYGTFYTEDEKSYITDKLKTWYPDPPNPLTATNLIGSNVVCKDNNSSSPAVLVQDINSFEYEFLKTFK